MGQNVLAPRHMERDAGGYMARASYSRTVAYVILLARVELDPRDLAELVWVGRDTIRRRLGMAAG